MILNWSWAYSFCPVFLPFILKLLSWITLAALEEFFSAISGALFLITVTYASVLPQMVEFFSTI